MDAVTIFVIILVGLFVAAFIAYQVSMHRGGADEGDSAPASREQGR